MAGCSCIAREYACFSVVLMADSTFAGSLTSTVTCSACQEPSITVDPILDIQLDFPTSPELSEGNKSAITLAGLLRRFCAEEKVVGDPGKGYACSSCGGGPGVVSVASSLDWIIIRSSLTPGRNTQTHGQEAASCIVFPAQGKQSLPTKRNNHLSARNRTADQLTISDSHIAPHLQRLNRPSASLLYSTCNPSRSISSRCPTRQAIRKNQHPRRTNQLPIKGRIQARARARARAIPSRPLFTSTTSSQ
jgi:hypothetical protein